MGEREIKQEGGVGGRGRKRSLTILVPLDGSLFAAERAVRSPRARRARAVSARARPGGPQARPAESPAGRGGARAGAGGGAVSPSASGAAARTGLRGGHRRANWGTNGRDRQGGAADLLVMATRGHTGVRRRPYGSVAEAVRPPGRRRSCWCAPGTKSPSPSRPTRGCGWWCRPTARTSPRRRPRWPAGAPPRWGPVGARVRAVTREEVLGAPIVAGDGAPVPTLEGDVALLLAQAGDVSTRPTRCSGRLAGRSSTKGDQTSRSRDPASRRGSGAGADRHGHPRSYRAPPGRPGKRGPGCPRAGAAAAPAHPPAGADRPPHARSESGGCAISGGISLRGADVRGGRWMTRPAGRPAVSRRHRSYPLGMPGARGASILDSGPPLGHDSREHARPSGGPLPLLGYTLENSPPGASPSRRVWPGV